MKDKEFIAVFHYDDGGSNRCGAEPYRYAEEIVRCRECKYADKCSRNVAMIDTYQMYEKIDFCSYGEREGE